MSISITGYLAERWRWGTLLAKSTSEQIVNALNNRLGRLSETLERIHQAAEFGPLPGSYLTIPLYCDTPDIEDGIAYTYMPQTAQGMRIIGLAASVDDRSDASSDLNIQVQYKDSVSAAWSSLVTATPITVSSASPTSLNKAGDFALSFFSLTAFRVNCTAMNNIPRGLLVLIFAKNLGRIEPV